jgi:hypothetical protein
VGLAGIVKNPYREASPEIKGIADRYMKAHPEEWQDPMASIIFEAVMAHFKELI